MAIATLSYSFVEQRSARQSVTLEIAGSIPVEAATAYAAQLDLVNR